jgi:hypothetical protein
MDPIIVSALAGVAIRAIAAGELLAQLWWRERQQRGHRSGLAEMDRRLPLGGRLEVLGDDGSMLSLVIEPASGERPLK